MNRKDFLGSIIMLPAAVSKPPQQHSISIPEDIPTPLFQWGQIVREVFPDGSADEGVIVGMYFPASSFFPGGDINEWGYLIRWDKVSPASYTGEVEGAAESSLSPIPGDGGAR